MPTLSVEKEILFKHLNRTYTDTEFDELCFEFGVELDEITSEREEASKNSAKSLSASELQSLSDKVIYKIDVPANRYDLLCIEGLSRALKIFLGDMKEAPKYEVLTGEDGEEVMKVQLDHTKTIRPYVVCAILKDVSLTQDRYESFIDLQDQLHRNLCRQRTLVAIGTHDMDTTSGPYEYDARPPQDIKFAPLTHPEQTFDSKALLECYETDPSCKHLKPYVSIIKDSELYPVVLDSKGTVMSLPPIINGSHSKITLETTNVFIECTATDLTKANIVLDTVVAMFSEYCQRPFTVHPVRVDYIINGQKSEEKSYTTPKMYTRTETASVNFINSLIGINIPATDMLSLCNRVQLGPATLLQDNQTLQVTVPPTRSDILHPVDIAEDVGIAFGYNNIIKRVPTTSTVGGEQPLNTLSDLLRDEIARAGYVEILTHGLCSLDDNFRNLGRQIRKNDAVSLSNPANVEYEVVRTTLLPGLFKTLQHNKSASFANGYKIFEISDVVVPDHTHVVTGTVVGAKNVRKLAAVYAGPTSGFEIVHGLVDRVMTLTEVGPMEAYVKNSGKMDEEKYRVSKDGWEYMVKEMNMDGEEGLFFPGRAANLVLKRPTYEEEEEVVIGTFGIVHPNVLKNFDIGYPASCLELDLEYLL